MAAQPAASYQQPPLDPCPGPNIADPTTPTVDEVNAFRADLNTWRLAVHGQLLIYAPGTAAMPVPANPLPANSGTGACHAALTRHVLWAATNRPIYLHGYNGYITGLATAMGQQLQMAIVAFG